jgi:hypothetical protein
MPEETGRHSHDPKVIAATDELLKSHAFKEQLACIVADVLQEGDSRRYPKKHACSRCYPPRNPCRPMMSVMMVPIPIFNPFWWAETCHPRPCGPSIPEDYDVRPERPERPDATQTIG